NQDLFRTRSRKLLTRIRLKETWCKRRALARCLAHVHLRSRRIVLSNKVWIGVVVLRTTFVVYKLKRPERNEYLKIMIITNL
ncbi:MAG: hypothetical protein ACC656_15640, partial [Candidatus Heimdallarchaeota archaeon]